MYIQYKQHYLLLYLYVYLHNLNKGCIFTVLNYTLNRKEMTATVETLKENRVQVINILIEMFGSESLKSKMNTLLSLIEEAELFGTYNSIEDCIEYLDLLSTNSRRKASKSAEMIAEMAEKIGEVWDSQKQMFIKI